MGLKIVGLWCIIFDISALNLFNIERKYVYAEDNGLRSLIFLYHWNPDLLEIRN